MTKLVGLVLVVGVLGTAACAAPADDQEPEPATTQSSEQALLTLTKEGAGGISLGAPTLGSPSGGYVGGLPDGATTTCPSGYVIYNGKCIKFDDPDGDGIPSGGYYTTYNPCRIGLSLYCNAFGVCTCA